MGSEVLLYGYGAVCLSMLAFNIVYNMVMKHSDLRSFRRARKIRTKIRWQLLLLRTGGGVQPKHIRYLKRRLLKLRWLIAFCDGAKELLAKEDAAVAAYDEALQPVIAYLAEAYQKRDDMQAAYFAYVLSKYRKKRHLVMDSVQAVLVGYMKRNSLYCHVNALEALYHFGSAESIVQAVRLLDEGDSFLHGKILTDGLLTYTGDHDTLCRLLWEEFEFLSVRMQVPILNYLRYRTGGFCKEMASLMTDPERDKEIRLCAVRYFGRYPYLPALSPLLDFISDQDPSHWEYAAVSASALSAYPKEQTIGALMEAMHSQNWYVRYNAAASLDTYHPDYPELLNIMEGHDRYAREMLMYRLSSTYQEEEKQREVG